MNSLYLAVTSPGARATVVTCVRQSTVAFGGESRRFHQHSTRAVRTGKIWTTFNVLNRVAVWKGVSAVLTPFFRTLPALDGSQLLVVEGSLAQLAKTLLI